MNCQIWKTDVFHRRKHAEKAGGTASVHGIALGTEWCNKHDGGEIPDAFPEYSPGKCREDSLYFAKDDNDHPHFVFEWNGKEYRKGKEK